MNWMVTGLIPEGFGILAASPKIGKSWLVMDIGLVIAEGQPVFGVPTDKRPVLYLALEDGHRRLQDRARFLLGDRLGSENWAFDTDPTTALEVAKSFAREHPDGFVIVDTFQLVAPDRARGESGYSSDYKFARELKDISPEHGSLIAVHHTTKADSADFLDTVSGTQGIAGAADFVIVLERPRQNEEGMLHVTGRDVEEARYKMRFNDGRWSPDGADLAEAARKASEKQLTDQASAIVAFVASRSTTNATDVVAKFGISQDAAPKRLQRLCQDGLIVRLSPGVYGGVAESIAA